jgi:hypothetical protein
VKRFFVLVGVGVVAAAIYVAASPASSKPRGYASAAQFKVLREQVGTLAIIVGRLNKTVKQLQTVAAAEAAVLTACDNAAIPIDQFGDGKNATPTEGYEYSPTASANTPSTFLTTALDVAPSSDTGAGWFAFGASACGTLLNGHGLRHAAAKAGIQLPHSAAHLTSFAAHRP